jgi:hypothetical protein
MTDCRIAPEVRSAAKLAGSPHVPSDGTVVVVEGEVVDVVTAGIVVVVVDAEVVDVVTAGIVVVGGGAVDVVADGIVVVVVGAGVVDVVTVVVGAIVVVVVVPDPACAVYVPLASNTAETQPAKRTAIRTRDVPTFIEPTPACRASAGYATFVAVRIAASLPQHRLAL